MIVSGPARVTQKQLLREMESGADTPGQAGRTKWPNFAQHLHNIYGDNKVALDSQHITDEGRGDR